MPETKPTPAQIERMYDEGENRVTQERNDFLLPQIRDFVTEKKWLNLRPEYQRRLVWDTEKKSRFIESLDEYSCASHFPLRNRSEQIRGHGRAAAVEHDSRVL